MLEIRQDLIECCHWVHARGYVAANDGNLSVRLDSNQILATPTGKSKGRLSVDDLVVVDDDGRVVEGVHKPSTELLMHRRIYDIRPDVMAVVHAHPVYATGFATANISLDRCVLAEIVTTLGSIPLAPYGTPSTPELSDSITEIMRHSDACLLANHGVVTCGKDIRDAYYKLERVEHYAHIVFVARMLGGEKGLTASQVTKLDSVRTTYGSDDTPNAGCVVCRQDCVGDDCSFHGTGDEDHRLVEMIRDIIRHSERP